MKVIYQFRWMLPLSASLFIFIQLSAQTPAAPSGVSAEGYDSHIEVRWQPVPDPAISAYQIFRSTDGGSNFDLLKTVGSNTAAATLDWTGDEGQAVTRHYRVKAVKNNGLTSDFSETAQAQTRAFSDEELLDMVQRYTFRYFWDYGHPVSGLARERSNGNGEVVTTGGSGFGIMAIIAGAERGWITRAQAIDRMVKIVSFLQIADRYRGVFPHWMNGSNGNTVPFSQFDDGADLVESAFLIQGLLAAREYFDQNTPLENAVRDAITGIWEDVEWDWFRKNNSSALYWHWSPNHGWQMNFPLVGFFEAQIVYILAAASPTHPVPGSLYQSGWMANPNYCSQAVYYGHPVYCGGFGGGPLFFAHYSYLGFDPRNWKDDCSNYFIRNRNHSLIQWEYAKSNPEKHAGYGPGCWGLTACDGPTGYAARDIHPANDDGTVAPTAALSSMPYVPAQSMAALKYFYRDLGEKLWGPYGFYDAFNLNVNWFAPSYLAIDQGPIVAMIENHRTGLFWDLFMKNPEIEPALIDCGFQPDNTVDVNQPALPGIGISVYPNPVRNGRLTLSFENDREQNISALLTDLTGKPAQLILSENMPAGSFQKTLSTAHLPPGIYFLQVKNSNNQFVVKKLILAD